MNTNERNTDQYRRMTETSLSELLVRLSIPAILSMLVTSIYNMVDTAFVGQLGTSASGAVGIVFSLMAILQAVGFMFGQGSGAIISRSLGKKDIEKASEVASTGFFLSFFIGIILACVSMFFLDQLVLTLGSTETIAPYAKTYCFYIILAAPFMMSSFVLNNILRFEGRAALGMIGMMAGGFLNMIGDPILMFGLNMGIAGAGLSTALSQIIS
ncbi:MAG TPA: MATE family efflux transporter, partial [Lachnospiraceae bacterium]|nr:MATE family efflux transporter [Lachnospiraceae bacterium]